MNQIVYRQCIGCRKVLHRASLWRIVRLASTHQVVLDRGMGRSAYLCPTRECLTKAKRKNRLQGALKTKVADNIYQSLQERLS